MAINKTLKVLNNIMWETETLQKSNFRKLELASTVSFGLWHFELPVVRIFFHWAKSLGANSVIKCPSLNPTHPSRWPTKCFLLQCDPFDRAFWVLRFCYYRFNSSNKAGSYPYSTEITTDQSFKDYWGSGCGSVGRAADSATGDPQFESHYQQFWH